MVLMYQSYILLHMLSVFRQVVGGGFPEMFGRLRGVGWMEHILLMRLRWLWPPTCFGYN